MRTLQPAIAALRKNLDSSKINSISVLILVLGLLFFGFWLANYAWTIVKTPYPAEYREGAILLFTGAMTRGVNPFALVNHPLMTNNYGFLYNLTVLPFSILFGNTLAIHRLVSILFVLASCTLIVLTLIRMGVAGPFAVSGGGLVLAGLLFHVTPLACPDSLGEFFFLLSVLIPWQRKFVHGVSSSAEEPVSLLSWPSLTSFCRLGSSQRMFSSFFPKREACFICWQSAGRLSGFFM